MSSHYALGRRCAALAVACVCICTSIRAESLADFFDDPGELSPGGPEWGGVPVAFSFSPQLLPDGVLQEYPRSLNPARQVTNGAAADSVMTSLGASFSNLNGNPAYFDANNLLTRPAALIENDAFWTDPRTGNFVSNGSTFAAANMGFFFDGPAIGGNFGFDVAIASVSTDLPTDEFANQDQPGPRAYLDFQIQDDLSYTARGRLIFGDGVDNPSSGEFYARLAGTFLTLNSPRTAYEARFRFDEALLRDLIAAANFHGHEQDSPYAPIRFFDIDLEPIATFGGTTQIAIDNFVLGGSGLLQGISLEPLTYRPLDPVGRNTPQYFVTTTDPIAGFDGTEAINLATEIALQTVDGQFDTFIEAQLASFDARTQRLTVTVPADSPLRNSLSNGGAAAYRLGYVEPDQLAPLTTIAGEHQIGGAIEATAITAAGVPRGGLMLLQSITETSNLFGQIDGSIANQLRQSAAVALGLADAAQLIGNLSPIARPASELTNIITQATGSVDLPAAAASAGGIGQLLNNLPVEVPSAILDPLVAQINDTTTYAELGQLLGQIGSAYTQQAAGALADQLEAQTRQSVLESQLSQIRDQLQSDAEHDRNFKIGIIRMMSDVTFQDGPGNPPSPILADEQTLGGLLAAMEPVDGPLVFINTSLAEYVAQAGAGRPLTAGDSGGFIEPIFDEAGAIVDLRFHSWIVGDQPGLYATTLTVARTSAVPEPDAWVMIAGASCGVLRFGRSGAKRDA